MNLYKEIEIARPCKIDYEEHSYAKNYIYTQKIKSGEITSEELGNEDIQEIYFQHNDEIHPTLKYYQVAYELSLKYKVNILYNQSKFHNYLSRKKVKELKDISIENDLDKIQLKGKDLLRNKYIFMNSKEKKVN